MTIKHKSLDFLVTTLWYLHVVNMVPNISTYFSGLQVNVPDYSRSISNSITFQSLKNQKFNSTTKGKHVSQWQSSQMPTVQVKAHLSDVVH